MQNGATLPLRHGEFDPGRYLGRDAPVGASPRGVQPGTSRRRRRSGQRELSAESSSATPRASGPRRTTNFRYSNTSSQASIWRSRPAKNLIFQPLQCGGYNQAATFPKGKHDDLVDSMTKDSDICGIVAWHRMMRKCMRRKTKPSRTGRGRGGPSIRYEVRPDPATMSRRRGWLLAFGARLLARHAGSEAGH